VNSEVQRYDHAGATLVDETTGAGVDRHIVFLHGWGASRDSLRGIAALFEPTHSVHLIDLPGFGDAPLPPSGWSTVEYADLVQRFLEARVRGPVVLVGHSFGARVSLRLAARKLDQVRAIVLMAAPGLPLLPFSKGALRRWGIRTLRQVLRATSAITGPAPLAWHTRRFGSKDYLAAGELRDVLVRVVNEDLTDTARAVACPVLLLWGSDDRETPPSLAFRFQELMRGRATLEILPHKDHYLYMATGAHLCAFKIRGWLDHVAW
jgi:pimeloyl-ACP methyl ester carboxylesterase